MHLRRLITSVIVCTYHPFLTLLFVAIVVMQSDVLRKVQIWPKICSLKKIKNITKPSKKNWRPYARQERQDIIIIITFSFRIFVLTEWRDDRESVNERWRQRREPRGSWIGPSQVQFQSGASAQPGSCLPGARDASQEGVWFPWYGPNFFSTYLSRIRKKINSKSNTCYLF